MKYKGIELKDIADTPQLVNPPREMLVWTDNEPPRVDKIYVIGPSSLDLPVRAISEDGRLGTHCYAHCAEIPKARATYRQVSAWLARGNGEITMGDTSGSKPVFCKTSLFYDTAKSNDPCGDEVRVRKLGEDDWHEPTLEYFGMEG